MLPAIRSADADAAHGPQVCRGTAVMMVSPTSGTEEIANPFQNAEEP